MLDVIDMQPFEAFVTINGQYCYTKDQVLFDSPICQEDIETVVSQVKAGVYDCQFQEFDCFYVNARTPRVVAMEQYVDQHYEVRDIDRALSHKVYQLNAYLYPGEEHKLMDAVTSLKYSRWSDKFIDVMSQDGGKEKGISCMLDYFGFDPSEVICFGDGGNDLGMFDICGHSVAVGEAQDCIKEKAEFITKNIEDAGIAYALEQLGLI